jgi:hypothetical protein
LSAYRNRSRLLNRVFLLSLVIQSSRVVAHFGVGLAMGWSLHAADLAKFFLVIPLLGLITALPISVGGWGVREWAGMALAPSSRGEDAGLLPDRGPDAHRQPARSAGARHEPRALRGHMKPALRRGAGGRRPE